MKPRDRALTERRQVLGPRDVERAIRRMAHQLVEGQGDLRDLVLIGIRTRGVPLAHRLAAIITAAEGITPPVGELDITLYRDDVFSAQSLPSAQGLPIVRPTVLPFEIQGRHVVLIDDVLYTGRTTRAALDALMDYGRPRCIRLAVLIDRGHRELPLHADFIGATLETKLDETVAVHLTETDGEDAVRILTRPSPHPHSPPPPA
jgi:pyrimidine operon attenuation protein/uracil phosphoribosyltransferase